MENLSHLKYEHEPCDLNKLKELVEALQAAEKRVMEATEKLAGEKRVYNQLSQEDIPTYLGQYGLSELKLSNGQKVLVTEDINVTIKDEDAFYTFLRERKEDDIIKISADFPTKMEEEDRGKLFDFLCNYDCKVRQGVHSQTLKKYFRELLGNDVDDEDRKVGLELNKYVEKETLEKFASIFTLKKTKIK